VDSWSGDGFVWVLFGSPPEYKKWQRTFLAAGCELMKLMD
jgi:hypothetical protein